ncbi:MAG: hypothetical protein AMS24_02025 [Chlamydiae bacterium SM23_39]|nr:MAG: hypothetical protein AMS24_02025 [Chlamydiae bacterium SM23_39]
MDDIDKNFMYMALKEAEKAFEEDEVPIGAVLVYKNKIIAKGYNQVERLKDATAHAEMICLTSAYSYFNDWRLTDTVLYSTLEPCLMCSGAIFLSRIKRIVYATEDTRVGIEWNGIDFLKSRCSIEIKKGVLKDISKNLLKKFFKKKRVLK